MVKEWNASIHPLPHSTTPEKVPYRVMQDNPHAPEHGGQDEETASQEMIQLCIFELSDRMFGLSIFDVQEIWDIEDAEITPVPTTPHFLNGVVNLRGSIVPIVDIREILQLPVKEPTKESRVMLLNIKTTQIGIFVDAISEVTLVPKQVVQPDTVQIGLSDGKFVKNIVQYHDGFLILLDLDHLYQAIQL